MNSWIYPENIANGYFSTRTLGKLKTPEEIQHVVCSLSPEITTVVTAQQVHGKTVHEVSTRGSETFLKIPETDGLFTTLPGVALTIKTADCVPILFSSQTAVGVTHNGWKGTVGRISAEMIATFRSHGISPSDIQVAIGPSIGVCCYSIDLDRTSEIRSLLTARESVALTVKDNVTFLNLQRLNQIQLEDLGIPPKNITVSALCTQSHTDQFYSFRGENRAPSGTNISTIFLAL